MPTLRLRTVIAVAISLIALTLTAGISCVIERDAVARLETEIGRSLALLADAAQDKLDRAMYGKLEALRTLSSVEQLSDKTVPLETKRLALDRFLRANRDFSWVGFAGRDGAVINGAGSRAEALNASKEAWFENGLHADFVGEANVSDATSDAVDHDASLKKNFLHISVPVTANGSDATGVLGATLTSGWAEEIKDSLLGGVESRHNPEIMILNENRRVLLGPLDLSGKVLDVPSIKSAKPGRADYASERWQDGTHYLTGLSMSDGYKSYSGLRWIVLVREDRNAAFASVTTLRDDIERWGFLFAAVAAVGAWFVAGRLSGSILRLASAAENLRLGRQPEIPEIRGYQEVSVLSRSLRSLVAQLTLQKAALAAANQSLEQQVQDRTRQLEVQNVNLKRAKIEAERATESKSRFLAAASHDLRQPLHALTLFARALSRRVSGDEAPMLVAQMEEALRALKVMFDALLNVSRLDARMIEPDIQAVSVGDIIDRVSVGFRVEAQQHGLRFLSRRADWSLQTDPALLEFDSTKPDLKCC